MKFKQWGPFRWPIWQRALFFGAAGAFWLAQAVFCYQIGNTTYHATDGSTEGMSWFAANHYLDHGFFENYLLPTYPPFGHDPTGKQRNEPFVYTHYLAGPDIVLALFMKVFGRDAMWADRLIPHTLSVLAMLWLCAEFAAYMGESLMGLLMLGLLFVPRSLTAWTICLYGHSYAMAFYLCLMAGFFRLINIQGGPPGVDYARSAARKAIALGFSVGFLQMFFDLDWLPLTFISACSFVVLMPRLPWRQGSRVLIAMVGGGTAALVYQIFISSLYSGSMGDVLSNLMQWISFRTGATYVEGQTAGDLRLVHLLQEYNRQCYGATGFTAFNLLAMSAAFLLMGWAARVKTARGLRRGLASIALAYLAAAFWNIVMRQHSSAHIHFLPRHYFAVYMNFLLVALPVGYALVVRSRALRTVEAV